MNDVVVNKIQFIQRYVRRAREVYHADAERFATNETNQDAALLNIVRACEMAIDLANHIVRTEKLGIPISSVESFGLLRMEKIIDPQLADRMEKMVGLRNLLEHHYVDVDVNIITVVIVSGLDDVLAFADKIWEHVKGGAA